MTHHELKSDVAKQEQLSKELLRSFSFSDLTAMRNYVWFEHKKLKYDKNGGGSFIADLEILGATLDHEIDERIRALRKIEVKIDIGNYMLKTEENDGALNDPHWQEVYKRGTYNVNEEDLEKL